MSTSGANAGSRKGRRKAVKSARWLRKSSSNNNHAKSHPDQPSTALVIDGDAMLDEKIAAKRGAIDAGPTTWLFVLSERKSPKEFATVINGTRTVPIKRHLQDQLREILEEITAEIDQDHGALSDRRSTNQVTATTAPQLTERQAQIATMIRDGASNKLIAKTLGLTVGTVKVHLHRIFRALGVNNRIQLAIHAHNLGIAGPSHGPAAHGNELTSAKATASRSRRRSNSLTSKRMRSS